jgi:hypothetical protein
MRLNCENVVQTSGVTANGHIDVEATLHSVVLTPTHQQRVSDVIAEKFASSAWAARLIVESLTCLDQKMISEKLN